MEVPEKKPKLFPGTEELMDCPGAISDKKEAVLEKLEITSDLLVEPKLIADEIHAECCLRSFDSQRRLLREFPELLNCQLKSSAMGRSHRRLM
jgi:hypothetical protein